jgi:hypothetical protein
MYPLLQIIVEIKSRKSGVGRMVSVKKRNKILVGIAEGNRSLGDLGSTYITE